MRRIWNATASPCRSRVSLDQHDAGQVVDQRAFLGKREKSATTCKRIRQILPAIAKLTATAVAEKQPAKQGKAD